MPPVPPAMPPAGAWGTSWPWDVEAVRAQQKARELIKTIQPSRLRVYRNMHPVAMTHFLSELGQSARSQEMPILVGRNGSPLDVVGQVLADRMGFGEAFLGQQDPLNNYGAVLYLDLVAVLGLASVPNEAAPHRVVEAAKAQALQQPDRPGILMLDHVEALRTSVARGPASGSLAAGGQPAPGGPAPASVGQAAADAMRAQLAARGQALVFGVYHASDEAVTADDASIGLSNAKVVRINTYNADETRDFIRDSYRDYWGTQGYAFANDAFDALFTLEPGCWISLRRTGLPYLVVKIAEDTMQTAMKGNDAIRQTAREAVNAIGAVLTNELPRAGQMPQETRDAYERTFRLALGEVQGLLSAPTPAKQGDRQVLKRAHVLAQLFCPNESEFHVPGFTPRV
jgi:hypothetical protein